VTMNVAIRGFLNRRLQFEEHVSIDPYKEGDLIREVAEKHALSFATGALHMIEIEFLDEPNPGERFFRFGADASRLTIPIRGDKP